MLVEDSGLTVERWNGVGSELSQILKSLKRRLGVGVGGGGEMVKKGEETKML